MKKFLVIAITIVACFYLGSCGNSTKKEKIVVRGSTSVEPLMEVLIDKFLETDEGKNYEFDMKCEGSGKGREAAENDKEGNVIGMSSSAISASDAPKFVQFDLAKDAVVLIVNKENQTENVTLDEVYNIYTGQTTKFTGIDTDITVVGRDAASGTREAFESLVKNANGEKLAGKMVNTAEQLEKTSAVIAKVSTVKSAIGYISLGSLDNTVKALTVNGVVPIEANVLNGTYVLYRPFVIIVNASLKNEGKLSEGVVKFTNFLQSEQAKTLVQQNKYIPVK